ncbi:hypothetical protein A1F99_030970 [Pyrenophora tritici-repentis]|nr:hypothetical protein A1F99_030970 [Pyrenophora tritici-repentis]
MSDQDSQSKQIPQLCCKFLSCVANAPALLPLELTAEAVRRAGTWPNDDAVIIFMLLFITDIVPNACCLEDYLTDIVLARIPLANQGCV